ncbi:3-phosphoshikimate 1-carboxyvinyltransferase [Marixanthomonas sp. SCSIO 43207]|uniref:3-phosphoshikimate 1-carboxyvinyltransferase n=1 Tax=Marixanthomonas sp. SCSIO 43207 TaxID=2779360 RepID=UPI001CA85A31|nr:3-phosphoshikimate 1-carboxyvinyltransferase [Marixanthomonas sp. SCSIO 43207]UAB81498.1 3-phosphoshikimate 1-carboxyvinyltransferase [Marixanthomonas sp. SCSIO 43207]
MKAVLTTKPLKENSAVIQVSGSKSESNRLLILQSQFQNLKLENLSESDDTMVLQKALLSNTGEVNIHHAGTAMRFLTAYFASQSKASVVLTGSERMQQRPIKVLVDALKTLGATIKYLSKEGYPPIAIAGKKISNSEVTMAANVSSQYISALLLIAPSLENGLTIHLEKNITSAPYLQMTVSLLQKIGVACTFSENTITVKPTSQIEDKAILIESDWSSASYFYSMVALSEKMTVTLKGYFKNSLQGDSILATIYESLGVTTSYNEADASITLSKNNKQLAEHIMLHLIDAPDIAQTIAVTCFGLGLGCKLTGLHTLKIKETDRLVALKTELEKLGAQVKITNDTLELISSEKIHEKITIQTYNDHRMAMAFAPLALKKQIQINDAGVVSKSFPTFWEDIQKTGIQVDFK